MPKAKKAQKGGCSKQKKYGKSKCQQKGEGPKLDALKRIAKSAGNAAVKGAKLAHKHRKQIKEVVKTGTALARYAKPGASKTFDAIDSVADAFGSGQKGAGRRRRRNPAKGKVLSHRQLQANRVYSSNRLQPPIGEPNAALRAVGRVTF